MATEVVMPQMGESIAEGTVTKWLVQPGDQVERDQPLFEISTDKVDAEIPSPADGVVLEIKVQEGDTVPVNDVVALIGEEGEETGDGAAEAEAEEEPRAEEEEKEEETPAAEEEAGEEAAAEDEREEADAEEARREEAEEEAGEEEEAAEEERAASGEERMKSFASPVVKRIAEEEDVDLAQVEGTGIHGRVTKKDVLAYLDQRGEAATGEERPTAAPGGPSVPSAPAPAAAAAAQPGPSGFSVPAYTDDDDVVIEPMSKIRQITAAHMRYSKDTSAHVTTVFHIDMSNVARIRARAKRGFQQANDTKLTFMPFIIKAVASALKAHPKVNASIDGTDIVYKKNVNVGIAVAMDRGLIVPVIRDADQLSLTGIAKAGNDLADRARNKKLSPDEIRGGTFTITNPGVFGSLFGTPVINQPQVAIMGVGAIEKRPIVVTDDNGIDSIAIKTMAYFAITYDHRLIDGADADHFMNDVKKILQTDSWSELEPFL